MVWPIIARVAAGSAARAAAGAAARGAATRAAAGTAGEAAMGAMERKAIASAIDTGMGMAGRAASRAASAGGGGSTTLPTLPSFTSNHAYRVGANDNGVSVLSQISRQLNTLITVGSNTNKLLLAQMEADRNDAKREETKERHRNLLERTWDRGSRSAGEFAQGASGALEAGLGAAGLMAVALSIRGLVDWFKGVAAGKPVEPNRQVVINPATNKPMTKPDGTPVTEAGNAYRGAWAAGKIGTPMGAVYSPGDPRLSQPVTTIPTSPQPRARPNAIGRFFGLKDPGESSGAISTTSGSSAAGGSYNLAVVSHTIEYKNKLGNDRKIELRSLRDFFLWA